MLPKLKWDGLVKTVAELGLASLPENVPEQIDESFLKTLHHILLETHIEQGKMTCLNCNHVYSIKDGIPNMLLSEDEV
ncbi:6067_t:CDS:2 [Paraglomus occultum]|uniref:6067_t:CDS:1 n=1 Tax=Paraglomus occultum TaxID=144539 RepID=A0A9N9BL64_9GLOM|nr:6067_t:CDS:2 [Paraglomus occultum]